MTTQAVLPPELLVLCHEASEAPDAPSRLAMWERIAHMLGAIHVAGETDWAESAAEQVSRAYGVDLTWRISRGNGDAPDVTRATPTDIRRTRIAHAASRRYGPDVRRVKASPDARWYDPRGVELRERTIRDNGRDVRDTWRRSRGAVDAPEGHYTGRTARGKRRAKAGRILPVTRLDRMARKLQAQIERAQVLERARLAAMWAKLAPAERDARIAASEARIRADSAAYVSRITARRTERIARAREALARRHAATRTERPALSADAARISRERALARIVQAESARAKRDAEAAERRRASAELTRRVEAVRKAEAKLSAALAAAREGHHKPNERKLRAGQAATRDAMRRASYYAAGAVGLGVLLGIHSHASVARRLALL